MEAQDDRGGPEDETKKRKRTRSGCLNCRRKKRKCDETRPSCQRCTRVGATCEWGVRISFRPVHGIPSPERPATAGTSEDQPIQYDILDVTDSVTREYYHHDAPGGHRNASHESGRPASRSPRLTSKAASSGSHGNPQAGGPASAMAHRGGDLQTTPHQCPQEIRSSGTYYPSSTTSPTQQAEHAASHLLSLGRVTRFAPSSTIGSEGSPDVSQDPVLQTTPSVNGMADAADDDIFRPGSTYLNLHSTLRHHIVQESRSTGPSRVDSPSEDYDDDDAMGRAGEEGADFSLTKEQEWALWVNWLDEVAPGLDKFDPDNHFQHTVSLMARSHPHLRYSIMAVSARQMERRGLQDKSRPTSLALYQQAIHLLLPRLTTRSTAVIASCVVLCVLEMLSCSPRAWQRHLDGCATLLQAVGIHGFSGGLEQALFWCFARMDVCGGIIFSARTLIPVSAWTPHRDLQGAIQLFRCSTNFGTYANQAVFLMAQVVDLLASMGPDVTGTMFANPPPHANDWIERWKELWAIIDEWYEFRPGEMQPVFASSAPDQLFPTILFSNAPAISGNQMYHTAAVLMLQHKPPNVTLTSKPRSIIWHARRIVGISRSNGHHGAWTNSLQPLWIAGKVFSRPEEHQIIVDLLDRIERESGWATKWRVDDLREWWSQHTT